MSKQPSRLTKVLLRILSRFGSVTLPDKLYLKLRYRLEMGESLNLDNPTKFSEKLQWLKLYNRRPEYTTMVDKYTVKEYVAKIIGDEYVIPTLGVWERPEDIDWDGLPNQFVLKTTHGGGGGGVIICRDKSTFNRDEAVKRLRQSMKTDIYRYYKEWPYKNVHKRIIAEKYMEETEYTDLSDFKFYCFDGKPKVVMFSSGRFTDNLCFDYYDMNWNKLQLVWDRPNSDIEHIVPPRFDEMKEIVEKLCEGIPHVRVDLYNIKNSPYFGELTFFDASGFSHFEQEEWNEKFGSWIHLPKSKSKRAHSQIT